MYVCMYICMYVSDNICYIGFETICSYRHPLWSCLGIHLIEIRGATILSNYKENLNDITKNNYKGHPILQRLTC